jgi:hypothetical protein
MKRLAELLLAGAIVAVLFARGIVEYAQAFWSVATEGNYQGVPAVDFNNILGSLFQGNNPILILLALFLFKDQIFALLAPKPPATTPLPVPANPATPTVPAPVVVTPEHPIIDQIIKTVLPVLVDLVLKQVVPAVKAQARAEADAEHSRSIARGA